MCSFFFEYSCSTNPKQWWICWLTNQRNYLSCETHHLWGASLRKRTPWMIILLRCIACGPLGAFVTFQDWLGFLQFNPPGNDHISHLKEKKLIFQTALGMRYHLNFPSVYIYINDIILLTSSLFYTFIQQHDSTDGGLTHYLPSLDPSHIITSAVCSSRDMIGPCGLVQSSVLMDHSVPASCEWGVGVGKRV